MTPQVDLESLRLAAATLPAEDLPKLLGSLEEVRCVALARLTSPMPQPQSPDAMLNVAEAAERLSMSTGYVYRHHAEFPFTRRIGRSLLFSTQGIQTYLNGAKRGKR